MIKINLLPWREERRSALKQQFYIMLGMTAIVAGLIAFIVNTIFSNWVEYQQNRNSYLQNEINYLSNQIKEIETIKTEIEQLIAKAEVIQTLQQNRAQVVHLFEELVATLPDGVYLTSIKQQGNIITLDGYALSDPVVSNYMLQLEESEWLSNIRLNQSATDADGEQKIFSIKLQLVSPKSDENLEDESVV